MLGSDHTRLCSRQADSLRKPTFLRLSCQSALQRVKDSRQISVFSTGLPQRAGGMTFHCNAGVRRYAARELQSGIEFQHRGVCPRRWTLLHQRKTLAQSRDHFLASVAKILFCTLSREQSQPSVQDWRIIWRDDEKKTSVAKHALDFATGGLQVVYKFKNANSDDAVEITVGKRKRRNRRIIELGMDISFFQLLGYDVSVAMNIDSVQFFGMQREFRH